VKRVRLGPGAEFDLIRRFVDAPEADAAEGAVADAAAPGGQEVADVAVVMYCLTDPLTFTHCYLPLAEMDEWEQAGDWIASRVTDDSPTRLELPPGVRVTARLRRALEFVSGEVEGGEV